jgi:hypothetical protein
MKIKYVFLSIFLTISLSLPAFGQKEQADVTKTDTKMHDMSKMMGKPTAEAIVDGLQMKVWIMTQEQHKMMKEKMGMSEMKDSSMKMNKAAMDSMMAGTHHIMLDLKDSTGGNEIASATANVLIESPSKYNSSVDLKKMMSHFGGSLTLAEKGEYNLKVSVIVGGVTKSTQFKYVVD